VNWHLSQFHAPRSSIATFKKTIILSIKGAKVETRKGRRWFHFGIFKILRAFSLRALRVFSLRSLREISGFQVHAKGAKREHAKYAEGRIFIFGFFQSENLSIIKCCSLYD
jgi:hypothetical protein